MARSIPCGMSNLTLVENGQELTERMIERLSQRNLPGVYIDTEFSDDIRPEEIYDPKVKREMNTKMSSCFKEYSSSVFLSLPSIKNINSVIDDIMNSIFESSECLLNVIQIEDYDNYTFNHSLDVATISVLVGMKIHLSGNCLRHLAMAGLLHDVGKLEVPIEIINKKAALLPEELDLIKEHADLAYTRLNGSPQIPSAVTQAIHSHHEKYDGTGYSRGLVGKEIPLYSRILALADVYDALTSQRPYRKAWMPHEAIEYMLGNSGAHFDPNLLDTFLKTVLPYPVGVVLQLSNQEICVVIKNNPDFQTRPIVKIIYPAKRNGAIIDLAKNFSYLNVTIQRTMADDDFPSEIIIK